MCREEIRACIWSDVGRDALDRRLRPFPLPHETHRRVITTSVAGVSFGPVPLRGLFRSSSSHSRNRPPAPRPVPRRASASRIDSSCKSLLRRERARRHRERRCPTSPVDSPIYSRLMSVLFARGLSHELEPHVAVTSVGGVAQAERVARQGETHHRRHHGAGDVAVERQVEPHSRLVPRPRTVLDRGRLAVLKSTLIDAVLSPLSESMIMRPGVSAAGSCAM